MPLASGADIAIGAYEFMLSTDVEEPYVHLYENLYGDESEIAGSKDKKTANKNILFWGYDDFRRGEGLRYYDKDQPDRWWTGNANPRIPGAITSPPTKSTASTITLSGGSPRANEQFFVTAGANVWYFGYDQGYWSTDGATWTENADVATELPAGYVITGAGTDGEYAYFAASDGTNRGIWRCTSTTAVDDFVAAHASTDPYRGIASRDQYLYAWTGGVLNRYTTSASLPITHLATHAVYSPSTGFVLSSAQPAEAVATDNSIVMIRPSTSSTLLFEYKLDQSTNKLAGREFWKMPYGFYGRNLAFSNGIIYVFGTYAGKLALWGYSVVNRQPLFLGYVGEGITGTRFAGGMAASYGAQITLGFYVGSTAYLYVYDAEEDSFSPLDTVSASDGLPTAVSTFKDQRLVSLSASAAVKIARYPQDTDTPAGAWTWDSSAYDIGYPQDEKVLLGFHVTLDPTVTNSTVRVWYQIDESGNWVDTGTDATAAAKHTYIQVSTGSSTIKYRTLRIRMVGASGARCFSVTSRSYINSKQEVWKLVLDLHNEAGTTKRKSNSASAAEKLRDNLHTLVSNGNIVTFKDGRRKRRKSSTVNTGYTSHTVLVEFPKDSVDSGREGTAEVILRSVAPSA